MFARLSLLASIAALALAGATSVRAAELKVAAPNAVKEAVADIAGRFEKETGHKLVFVWSGSEAIAKRVSEGEVFDVVINTSQGIDRLAKDGKLTTSGKRDFAKSGVAVAVSAQAARPDISSAEALKNSLLAAKSIAISSGASGRYLEQLFQKLGIADQIRSKIVQPPSGAQIGDLLARGEAEMGFQQVAELMHAKGFQYIGPLPEDLQSYTIWAASVHAGAFDAAAAGAFVAALVGPSSAATIRAGGMQPTP